jgi:hypothetical protein
MRDGQSGKKLQWPFLDRSTNWELKILPQVVLMVRRAR